jgi:hypothetical protein
VAAICIEGYFRSGGHSEELAIPLSLSMQPCQKQNVAVHSCASVQESKVRNVLLLHASSSQGWPLSNDLINQLLRICLIHVPASEDVPFAPRV